VSDDLCFMSATELLARYRARTLSPVEATKAVLDRIERVNPKLNAYCLVDWEGALAAARESEARWIRGEPRGRLDGVPTSIKDIVLTKGWPTLRGSKTVDRNQPWDEDAPATARLREHGAVLLGKTTTPEFGWKGVTDSPLTGITRNPWNLDLTPGGSSGGASAQVAAGLGQLAVGTDGGGSIRIPASFAGIFGIKPSFGRVPAYPLSPFGTLAHLGPMTRSVGDGALMLNVLSLPDARDWFALPYAGVDFTRDLDGGVKGLKIAFSPALGYAPVQSEVAAVVAQAAKVFAELGAAVDEIDPGFADPTPIFRAHWMVGAFNGLRGVPPEKRALMDPGLVAAVDEGAAISLAAYLDAVNARGQLGIHMKRFHERYHLLLTPTLAVPPFEVGRLAPASTDGTDWTRWTPFTYPFNLTQQPAASVPAGFTGAGLPVGLQIVGPMHQETLVLRAARAFERARPWAERRPPL
jgi:aspartyl-tRNA(Asn)/glutamyl-tRNA(Gln) amidotransferase subunit A